MTPSDAAPKMPFPLTSEPPLRQEPERHWAEGQEFGERTILATGPALCLRGVCLWLTGLSGAGKTTTAKKLALALEAAGRRVSVLDGDEIRTWLSRRLGFSKEDRDANVRLIGYVAAEIVRHGGIVICAAISPYRATRQEIRHLVGDEHFVEVFVDTPLAVCEARDVKGLYRRARRGDIQGFTGIDDPYEPPEQPEIHLDTLTREVEDNVRLIIAHLRFQRLIFQ
ncbi:MAG: adenylyl-sulfate kinase [Desulfobaccales bacterium]